ncbi:MAG: EamA family transporter [Tissierella sp.]|nr:EamA family transporter [Tissierella sp.]
MDIRNNVKGILLVIISTILWALNGNVGSYLFKYKGVTPDHLTMFRLIFAGLILLIYEYYSNNDLFDIFQEKSNSLRLIYFAFCGLLAMQYGYFAAVKYSNAATATILQSMAPFIIVIITSIIQKKIPSKNITFALVFALIGAFLLITHGNIDQLAITKLALIFGLLAAIGSVGYNLAPISLQKRYSTTLIMGWAMFISGVGFMVVFRPLNIPIVITVRTILGIFFVVTFGTLFPFLFYLMGSKIIGAQRASILSLIEPVAATIIAVLFMGEKFKKVDYIGIGLVVFALFLLNGPEKKLESNS